MPDEVRMVDNDKALLFIRGEKPLIDNKFDLLKHPNISKTKDGGMPPYKHGRISHMIDDWYDIPISDNEYELLSDEEMDEFAEKTAKKWGVDCEELCSEFFEFSDYVHGD